MHARLSGAGLVAARPQDRSGRRSRRIARGAGLAAGEPGRPPQGHPPRPLTHHLEGGGRGVARGGRGGCGPHPLGRPLQALRSARLPASTQPPRPAPARPQAPDRDHADTMLQDFADQLAAHGLVREQRPQHDPPAARDLPARPPTAARSPSTPPSNSPSPPSAADATGSPPRPKPAALLAALPDRDRAIWATALYAGLRLGELQALNWNDIDLEHNLIHVQRSWDRQAGFIAPKSRSGTPPRPDHHHPPPPPPQPPPPPRNRRTRIRLPQQTRHQPLQPRHPHTPHHAKPGPTPASPRSASTNAATPTPPT